MSESKRRFPANVSLEKETFLNNKKINGELYGMLQSLAQSPFIHDGTGHRGKTIVYKKDLPSQSEICAKLEIKSPKTLRTHLKNMIDAGYLLELESGKGYVLPEQEDIYLMIPIETTQYLWDSCKEHVFKIYVYLGQRFKYIQDGGSKNYYDFTLNELGQHLGIGVKNHSEAYRILNNALSLLQTLGLISFEEVYKDKTPYKRLYDFSFYPKGVIFDSQ